MGDSHSIDVVNGARRLAELRLVLGTVGNVSMRVADGMLITPSRSDYDGMTTEDLVRVDAGGVAAPDQLLPSQELQLHSAVYRARADVRAVVHTHSPYAVAWSFLGTPLTPELEEQRYYKVGAVRVADHAPPGSIELGRNAVAALGASNAVLLARHGVLTVGESVATAVTRAEIVEHQAQIAWLLRNERLDTVERYG